MKDRLVLKSDIIFAVMFIVIGIIIWSVLAFSPTGTTVVIKQDGAKIASYSLAENTQFSVQGEYTNTFEISDGAIRVIHTNCPNHQCEKSGEISAVGSSLVCAPNHVSATIIGEGGEIDAIAG